MNYSVENLDVYRRSVVTGARLCRAAEGIVAKGSPFLAEEVQRRAMALVANLADGLGFWEKDLKEDHFSSSKKAVLEMLPLLEIVAGLELLEVEEQSSLSDELRDLARMISGLLRGAKKKEKKTSPPKGNEEKVCEGGIVYH